MKHGVVKQVFELGTPPWPTLDPFLFCVHHRDAYPEGDDDMGPRASLAGRALGHDFSGKDGWSMYHGRRVPGFPRHPHRGFETITLARDGFIDHADSLGATARFGHGDVQWMTAGRGIVHSEAFPLVHRDRPNPTELFQIWLNLPREDKRRDPYFTMFWHEQIPTLEHVEAGRVVVRAIAGALGDLAPPAPPPDSWASREEAHIAVWTIEMEPGATWRAPAAAPGVNRVFYVFEGDRVALGGREVAAGQGAVVAAEQPCELVNGPAATELLMLQGKPIGEPVVQHGPFVMNTPGEIRQAMVDYQTTQFGGWPWAEDIPVHDRDQGRFAIHADGRRDHPRAQGS